MPGYKFDYGYNFKLKDVSAAGKFGNDGTDCGIYGGNEPYKDGAVQGYANRI